MSRANLEFKVSSLVKDPNIDCGQAHHSLCARPSRVPLCGRYPMRSLASTIVAIRASHQGSVCGRMDRLDEQAVLRVRSDNADLSVSFVHVRGAFASGGDLSATHTISAV